MLKCSIDPEIWQSGILVLNAEQVGVSFWLGRAKSSTGAEMEPDTP